MIQATALFQIGKITRTHGIHGEVELQFTDDAFERGNVDYLILQIEGLFVPFFFEEYRFKNQEAALFTFADIDSEEKARSLVGISVFYPHAALPADEEPQIRNVQAFVGFEVLVPDHSQTLENDQMATCVLGRVVGVNTTAATTVFVIVDEETGHEYLIPFHEDFVLDLNLKERYLLLQLPEGLLDLN